MCCVEWFVRQCVHIIPCHSYIFVFLIFWWWRSWSTTWYNMAQHGTVSSLKLQQHIMTHFDEFLCSLPAALSYLRSRNASSSLLPPLSTILITNPQSVTIQKWLAALVPILCTLSWYVFTFQVIKNKHIIVSQYLAELMRNDYGQASVCCYEDRCYLQGNTLQPLFIQLSSQLCYLSPGGNTHRKTLINTCVPQ